MLPCAKPTRRPKQDEGNLEHGGENTRHFFFVRAQTARSRRRSRTERRRRPAMAARAMWARPMQIVSTVRAPPLFFPAHLPLFFAHFSLLGATLVGGVFFLCAVGTHHSTRLGECRPGINNYKKKYCSHSGQM
nr:hypothetical protein [Pandoravirus belohorizontensis]